ASGGERLVREVECLAIMRLPEEQPHGRGVDALLPQVTRGEKVAKPLRLLRPTHVQEFAVEPDARKRSAGRPLGLRDLVLVVRKNQIDTARVDVERFGVATFLDLLERHRRALEVPPRTP